MGSLSPSPSGNLVLFVPSKGITLPPPQQLWYQSWRDGTSTCASRSIGLPTCRLGEYIMLNLRRRFILLPLITVLAGSSPLVSKSKNKNQDQSPDLTLKSQTELVLVPVIVTDKSKAHVRELKHEDFRLLENGMEERIAIF